MSRKKATTQARFILDGLVAIAWCFPDEQDTYAQSVLDALADGSALVPDLWHLEVANVLLIGERRKRSTQADTVQWLQFLDALKITVDPETRPRAFREIISLARTHNLSAYDAAYLKLALRHALPLATLDHKLREAARSAGVALFPFV